MNKKLSILFLSTVFSMNAMYQVKKEMMDRLKEEEQQRKLKNAWQPNQKIMALLKGGYYHKESQDALDRERSAKRYKQNNEQE